MNSATPISGLMPVGSVWSHGGWKRPMVVFTVIAHDEGKAIVRCEAVTGGVTIYRAVDEHEYSTCVTKMYERALACPSGGVR